MKTKTFMATAFDVFAALRACMRQIEAFVSFDDSKVHDIDITAITRNRAGVTVSVELTYMEPVI